MEITITREEQSSLMQQTWRDPEVIMSFFDWYGRLSRSPGVNDREACRIALEKQREKSREVYEAKEALLRREIRRDHAFRLRRVKRARSTARFMTKCGIRVRSKIEKIIADFLYDHAIRFEYEPVVDLGGFHVLPDFHLTDYSLCIEHFGLQTPEYKAAAEAKLQRYARFGVRVICTYPEDEPEIERILSEKLRNSGVPIPGDGGPSHSPR